MRSHVEALEASGTGDSGDKNEQLKSKPECRSQSKARPEHDPQVELQICEDADAENSEELTQDSEDMGEEEDSKEKPCNPFEVPKKYYNRQIFEAVNPFVEVTSIPVGKTMQIPGDKVADGRMVPADTLQGVADLVYDEVAPFCKSIKQPQAETGGRLIHLAYLQALWHCTKTSSNVLPYHGFLKDQDHLEMTEDQDDPESMEDADEDIADMQVKIGGPVVVAPRSDECSSSSTEPAEQWSTDLTKYDLKVRVDDERIGGERVTVLVIECAWEKLPLEKTYRAAGYAMKDATSNMKRGRYEPLFVQAWGRQDWRHGIIVPHGLVTVENGQILEVQGLSDRHKATLDRQFEWKAMVLAKDYQLQYPDGEYVAAELFVFEEKFPFNFAKFKFDEDTDHFLSSLLRIIVGDRTLSWSIDDFKDVVKERLKLLRKEKGRKRKRRQSSSSNPKRSREKVHE